MQVNILSGQNSLLNQFIAEIRNIKVQNDRIRFRKNLERIGGIFAYEISKTLSYISEEVETPLGKAQVNVLVSQPVLACILRAGLPLHQGLLNYFDGASNSFISAYRRHQDDGSFNIHLEYLASPSIENKVLILSDPMLATGRSMVLCYQAMLQKGNPQHVHIVSILASKQGLDYTKKNMPSNATLWIGVVDNELNAEAYILPGLGDAGDLAFGKKI